MLQDLQRNWGWIVLRRLADRARFEALAALTLMVRGSAPDQGRLPHGPGRDKVRVPAATAQSARAPTKACALSTCWSSSISGFQALASPNFGACATPLSRQAAQTAL
jgi:hypothetical protein